MPITARGKSCTQFLAARLAFRSLVCCLVLFVFPSSRTVLCAQTIEVKIVNGRNGHPIADSCMNVWVGEKSNPKSAPLLETQTDTNGVIKLSLSDKDTNIDAQSQQLVCGLRGLTNPVVKYGDTISVRAGYVLCQSHKEDYSWLAMTDFPTKEVVEHGIVTANTCGKATASPEPGKLIVFVRPLSWWEKMKQ